MGPARAGQTLVHRATRRPRFERASRPACPLSACTVHLAHAQENWRSGGGCVGPRSTHASRTCGWPTGASACSASRPFTLGRASRSQDPEIRMAFPCTLTGGASRRRTPAPCTRATTHVPSPPSDAPGRPAHQSGDHSRRTQGSRHRARAYYAARSRTGLTAPRRRVRAYGAQSPERSNVGSVDVSGSKSRLPRTQKRREEQRPVRRVPRAGTWAALPALGTTACPRQSVVQAP